MDYHKKHPESISRSGLNFSVFEKIPAGVGVTGILQYLRWIGIIFPVLLIFQCFFPWTKNAHAHPTSFEGGFAFMSEMSQKYQEISIVYSPKYWLGVGAVVVKDPKQFHLATSQIGWLVKRWNLPEAQGNSYFLGGIGYGVLKREIKPEISGNIYRFGIQLDYETRRIYTFVRYMEQRFFKNNKRINDQLSAAVGFAPYLGESDELNSFVIFKLTTDNRFHKKNYILMLRFFYKSFLWEIGQDFSGNPQFNFMARF